MQLLLDTNAILWWLSGSARISEGTRRIVASPSNTVYVSAISAWEISVKAGAGRLKVPPDIETWLPDELAALQFVPLAVSLAHAVATAWLPQHHADPFDRLLIAQALLEKLTIVTSDEQLERYDVAVIRC